MTTATATAATTRTVVSHRPGTYTIHHRQQDDTGKVLHRTDGPAHIAAYPNDDNDHLITVWYDHTAQHRLDGPAYTSSDGDMYWGLNGVGLTYISKPLSRDGS